MESRNAATRGKIGRVYDAAAEKLGITKGALKKVWRKERASLKETVWAKNKADTDDRDAMQKVSQMFGDTAMGQWAAALASSIPEAGADASSSA